MRRSKYLVVAIALSAIVSRCSTKDDESQARVNKEITASSEVTVASETITTPETATPSDCLKYAILIAEQTYKYMAKIPSESGLAEAFSRIDGLYEEYGDCVCKESSFV